MDVGPWRSVINVPRCYQARVRVCEHKRLSQSDESRLQFQHRQRGALHSVNFHGRDKFTLRKKGEMGSHSDITALIETHYSVECFEHMMITM